MKCTHVYRPSVVRAPSALRGNLMCGSEWADNGRAVSHIVDSFFAHFLFPALRKRYLTYESAAKNGLSARSSALLICDRVLAARNIPISRVQEDCVALSCLASSAWPSYYRAGDFDLHVNRLDETARRCACLPPNHLVDLPQRLSADEMNLDGCG